MSTDPYYESEGWKAFYAKACRLAAQEQADFALHVSAVLALVNGLRALRRV